MICTTAFLGGVAVFTSIFSESLKRWWSGPVLSINYEHGPPGSHKTRLNVIYPDGRVDPKKVFYFRFAVTNRGRSTAHRCEAVLEELWVANSRGGLEKLQSFGPIGLRWGAGYDDFVEINPSRVFFCDFLSIPDHEAQEIFAAQGDYVDLVNMPANGQGVVLSARAAFYSQPNRLPPGTYRLKVAVFSENAAEARARFEVDWSGVWQEDLDRMLAVVRVRRFPEPP